VKICTVVGARPQFIKAATVSRAVAQNTAVNEVLIHTGQHYDANMSGHFFAELFIPEPKYHLNIGSASHGKQTGQMLEGIEEVLIQEQPDWVLVYGDTNSTLAGALAAAKLNLPVAHVEAGLRSFNRQMPEEINRITTDHLSSVLFVPTQIAHQQLLKEGIEEQLIFNVGDVMYDATLFYNEYNTKRITALDQLNLNSKDYILATIHRAENTDNIQRLTHICTALIELSNRYQIILPLHPRTRAALARHDLLKIENHVTITEPVGFLDMLALEQNALCIITDSGGVQKEAYFNKIPCITLRNETEWVELVSSGWNKLCSPDVPFSLVNLMEEFFNQNRNTYKNFYGNGEAASKILQILFTDTVRDRPLWM
jgi:UDP-GlcNAc3NAcA epimerase